MPEVEYSPALFAWLEQHAANLPYSQYGEDGLLTAIFDRIGVTNRFCCEVGAADGLFFSNTRRLIEDGWSALLIEANEKQFARLAEVNRGLQDRVTLYNYRIAPLGAFSLDTLLERAGAPVDLDLLVIDIDGQDAYVLNALSKFRPRVLVVEYNPFVDPMFMPALGAETGQAGLQVTATIAMAREHYPIVRTFCNLICVRRELAGVLAEVVENPKVPEYNCSQVRF